MSGHSITVDESGGSIGRAATNTLALPDPNRYVSSLHAKIVYNGTAFEIVDQSTNGTFLNNLSQALVKGQPKVLSNGDQILMGPFVLQVEVEGATDEGAAEATSIGSGLDDTSSMTIPPESNVGLDDLDRWLEPDAPEPEPMPKLKPATSEEDDALLSAGDKELDPLAALGKDAASPESDLNFGLGAGDWNAPEAEIPNGDLGGQRMDVPGMIPDDWDKSIVAPRAPKTPPPPASEPAPLAPGPSAPPAGGMGSLLDLVNTPSEQLKQATPVTPTADPLAGLGLGEGPAQPTREAPPVAPQSVELPVTPAQPEIPLDDTGFNRDLGIIGDASEPETEPPQPKPAELKPAEAELPLLDDEPIIPGADDDLDNWLDEPEEEVDSSSVVTEQMDAIQDPSLNKTSDASAEPPIAPAKPAKSKSGSPPTGRIRLGKGAAAADPLSDLFGEAKPAETEPPKAPPEPPKMPPAPEPQAQPAAKQAAVESAAEVPVSLDGLGLARELANAMGLQELPDDQLVDLMPVIGKFVLQTIDGVMKALRARQTIKNEFRMNLTMIQAAENNPLKFSLSTEDAIENLFMKQRKAYMTANESIEEAFGDIADHQLALFNGIRAAYDSLMEEFDPAKLEKRFERQRGKSLFGGGGKKWDAYQAFIEELNEDQEKTFKHLFGETFAEHYERSFEALKAKRGK